MSKSICGKVGTCDPDLDNITHWDRGLSSVGIAGKRILVLEVRVRLAVVGRNRQPSPSHP